jgi:ABC-type ATPase involved in cell division
MGEAGEVGEVGEVACLYFQDFLLLQKKIVAVNLNLPLATIKLNEATIE